MHQNDNTDRKRKFCSSVLFFAKLLLAFSHFLKEKHMLFGPLHLIVGFESIFYKNADCFGTCHIKGQFIY